MNTISDLPASSDDVTEVDRLRREIARLQSDNDDLRASAAHWLRMYDAVLRRVNDLEARSVSANATTSTPTRRS